MRKAFIAFGALVLLTMPAFAGGHVSVFGGYQDTQDAGNDTGMGLGLALGLGRNVEFLVRFAHFGNLELENGEGVTITPVDVGLNYYFRPGEKLDPYVGGGFGYIIVSTQHRDAQNSAGWYGQAGLDFRFLPNWVLFGEVLYRSGTSDLSVTYGSGRETIDLAGVGANVGIALRW